MTTRVISLAACGLVVCACAQGAGGGGGSEDGGGGAPAGSGGAGASTSSTTGGSGGSPASGGDGGGGDGPTCAPPEHLCGGICVGNTPETGCYQSTDCNACSPVEHGTTSCTEDGLCDFECTAPYSKSGSSCICPTECCGDGDCSGDATCESGSCVEPCDDAECAASCILQSYVGGVCQGNDCVCF